MTEVAWEIVGDVRSTRTSREERDGDRERGVGVFRSETRTTRERDVTEREGNGRITCGRRDRSSLQGRRSVGRDRVTRVLTEVRGPDRGVERHGVKDIDLLCYYYCHDGID